MHTLILVRHAKSSWGDLSLPDFDRPLNERGKTDAPVMAKRLLDRKIKIDAFISSPAKRAKKTCRLFCKAFDADENDIIFAENLYDASLQSFYNVIKSVSNQYKKVAVFAHNPGITELANRLCETVKIDEMPTCGIFAVEIDIKKWEDFSQAEKKFLFFDYPKAG